MACMQMRATIPAGCGRCCCVPAAHHLHCAGPAGTQGEIHASSIARVVACRALGRTAAIARAASAGAVAGQCIDRLAARGFRGADARWLLAQA